jgi:hypothetical protein
MSYIRLWDASAGRGCWEVVPFSHSRCQMGLALKTYVQHSMQMQSTVSQELVEA